ncbi:MAG: hypothetical protein ACYCQJ_12710 [Nitrososphaerales archaeon]
MKDDLEKVSLVLLYARMGFPLATIKRKSSIRGDELINKLVQENFLLPIRRDRSTFFEISENGAKFLTYHTEMSSLLGMNQEKVVQLARSRKACR